MYPFRKARILFALFLMALSLRPIQAEAVPNIVEIAAGDARFSTLVAAVQAAGLVDVLQSEGPFTVFAPTNEAFAALPEGVLAALLKPENKDVLTRILLYHVVPGRLTAGEVVQMESAKTATAEQQLVYFSVVNGQAKVNNANIIQTDIHASNGVIHVIDAVLLPKELQNLVETAQNSSIFISLIEAAGLGGALSKEGPITVFAPTNAAFNALPAGTLETLGRPENRGQLVNILLYHIVAGRLTAADVVGLSKAKTLTPNQQWVHFRVENGQAKVNNATVVQTDAEAANGIVHSIDSVLIPAALPDIVETAKAAGSFNTLLAALEVAGLTEALKSPGLYTVFAPTDEAFAKLPAGTVETLLLEKNRRLLIGLLTYHVVPGKIPASEVVGLSSATTLNGYPVQIQVSDSTVMVNNAKVTATDIETSNGVIHVVDSVILPPLSLIQENLHR